MKTRAITALFFVAAMISSFMFGSVFFGIFYLVLAGASLFEFYGMWRQAGFSPQRLPGICLGLAGFLMMTSLFQSTDSVPTFLLFLFVPVILAIELFSDRDRPFQNTALTIFGFAYVILPFYCFYALGFLQVGFEPLIPLGFLVMLWANDTGAYLTGRFLGRTKLFERVSPNKTWEGFVGGILVAVLAAVLLNHFTAEVLPLKHWLALGLIIGAIGTLGDLVESLLKRSLSLKDSGKLLPGHGGLLDRFDGLLLAAPAVYVYLHLVALG